MSMASIGIMISSTPSFSPNPNVSLPVAMNLTLSLTLTLGPNPSLNPSRILGDLRPDDHGRGRLHGTCWTVSGSTTILAYADLGP